MEARDSRARRFDRRHFMTALAAGPLVGLARTHRGAAQTPVAAGDERWQTWAEGVTAAPEGSLRWRTLRYRAQPISEAPFANRTLGFVWNDYGTATLVVHNATQGITYALNEHLGERAVSFNHDQDSEARGFLEDDKQRSPYPYLNFTLTTDEVYDDKEEEGELRGWSEPFTLSGQETHLAFGSVTIAQREAVVYAPSDGATDQLPVFAMCLEGRFSPIHEGWQDGGPEIHPGDFIELSADSPITHLYGSGRTNTLVGVRSPGAGGIEVVNLAS